MLAGWAEMGVVLTDEFRDGNVPAMMAPLTVAKRAFAALPHTVQTYYFRGDSACHESNLVDWLRDEQRGDGPHGRDRKSTRLNSSHGYISYAVFCLKKKKNVLSSFDDADMS